MKLSKKFVSDYISLPDKDIKAIADDMTNAGNEYDFAGKLVEATNLVVGKIISSVKHPEADKLRVNKVDIGDEVLDIVCGAPNCREGLKVIVAKVGAVLPDITIKKSTIRGCESCGMMCSLNELGIDSKFLKKSDSEGIHELDQSAVVGTDPVNYLDFCDEVIDFELTSNRGDLLSVLGMAYELGAIYKKEVTLPCESYNECVDNIKDEFNLSVETEDCSLYLAKKVKNLVIKPSPDFIRQRLIASGMRPINNVVDISNYVMLETGQPLHFYDADALGDKIVVRNALENEELITLDNNKRVLSASDIVITDGKKVVGLAGVMGGLSTEVESTTKNIIIESAIFDSIRVRKTSKKILRSEASNRFEKGLDPKRSKMAINRCAHLLEKYADATITGGVLKCGSDEAKENVITVPLEKVSKVLGLVIPSDEIISILVSLGFDVLKTDLSLKVTVPSRRLDLKICEDIIEEIGRIYGIDNIQGKLPLLDASVGKYNKVKREIRNKMVSLGLNETLSYTLISEKCVHDFTLDEFKCVKIADPMSQEKNTLRYSLLHSLKEVYLYNKARNMKDVFIFEIGKGFYFDNEYKEELKLGALLTGDYNLGVVKRKVNFYTVKGIAEELLDYLGYSGRYTFSSDGVLAKELHPKQSANIIVQGAVVGIIGKVHPKELKDDVFVLEINLDKVLKNKASKMSFKEISKYPSVKKDLAFVMNKSITSASVEALIKKSGGKLLTNISVFDVYTGENVLDNEKSIAYTLTFSDKDKTLTEEEVMVVFNKIMEEVSKKLEIKVRDK